MMRTREADAPSGVVKASCAINANGTTAYFGGVPYSMAKTSAGTYIMHFPGMRWIIEAEATIAQWYGGLIAVLLNSDGPGSVQVSTFTPAGAANDLNFALAVTGYPKI